MSEIIIEDQSPDGKPVATIDLSAFIAACSMEYRKQLVAVLADSLAGDDFIDAMVDPDTGEMTGRGSILRALFVRRAVDDDAIPEDYEPRWIAGLRRDADALHRLIVEGRTDDAVSVLRDMIPDQQFLSLAAEKMIAEGLRAQGSLPL